MGKAFSLRFHFNIFFCRSFIYSYCFSLEVFFECFSGLVVIFFSLIVMLFFVGGGDTSMGDYGRDYRDYGRDDRRRGDGYNDGGRYSGDRLILPKV